MVGRSGCVHAGWLTGFWWVMSFENILSHIIIQACCGWVVLGHTQLWSSCLHMHEITSCLCSSLSGMPLAVYVFWHAWCVAGTPMGVHHSTHMLLCRGSCVHPPTGWIAGLRGFRSGAAARGRFGGGILSPFVCCNTQSCFSAGSYSCRTGLFGPSCLRPALPGTLGCVSGPGAFFEGSAVTCVCRGSS